MARPTTQQSQSKQIIGQSPNFAFGFDARASFLPTLSGLNLLREMERMHETDETVGAMDWCINTTMAQVDWTFVPQVEGQDNDKDAEAVKWADWAKTLLGDMKFSMMEHIEEAMMMARFGFAPCEIVTKQRDGVNSKHSDNYYGIEQLPLRDPQTIFGWGYDNRQNLTSMRQMSPTGGGDIPLWKVLHFRFSSVFDRPQGRPMMLNAYRVWRLKNKVQDAEAIGIERDLCGLPMFRMPKAIIQQAMEVDKASKAPTQAALEAQMWIANANKAVTDMRFNKSGGLLLPSDTFFDETSDGAGSGDRTPMFDFKIVTTAGQRSIDTRTVVRDYDRAIARVAMMQFLHLGERSTGSFALSDDQSGMAISSFMALAMKIAGEWNKKVVPLIWSTNGFDPRYMPRLRASDISKDSLQVVAQVLGALGKSGGLWESDAEMRIGIAKKANIPYNREAQQTAAATAAQRAVTEATAPKPTFGSTPDGNRSDEE